MQTHLHTHTQTKRLQTIGHTKWSSSKQAVKERVLGTFVDPESSTYVDLITYFTETIKNEKFKPNIRAKA